MAQRCKVLGAAFLARFYEVDQCSYAPIAGGDAIATNCIRNVEIEPQIEEGESIIFESEAKRNCITINECDDVSSHLITLEHAIQDWELYNLLTGNDLIADPDDPTLNVGAILRGDTNCHPYVGLEIFYRNHQEGVCDPELGSGAAAVTRQIWVVRFSEPTIVREGDGTLRARAWSGRSELFAPDAYGDGPFNDSYIDFAGDTDAAHKIEFEDTILASALEGACGFLTIPAQV